MLRYKQLLHFAEKLEPLAVEHQTPENKVEGCVSQVWVKGRLEEDGTVTFQAESDSQLTKVRRKRSRNCCNRLESMKLNSPRLILLFFFFFFFFFFSGNAGFGCTSCERLEWGRARGNRFLGAFIH